MRQVEYIIDKKLPGMLRGKILPKHRCYAKIKHIDINQALKVPGVKCVLTRKDCPYRDRYAKWTILLKDPSLKLNKKVEIWDLYSNIDLGKFDSSKG